MQAGASTACFYPLETERALQQVTELGFPFAEVFFNARQELRPAFVRQLAAIARDGGTQVVSVHPFSSFMESSCIFGDYQRRFEDTIDIYKETCHAAALLGAQFVVIHGGCPAQDSHSGGTVFCALFAAGGDRPRRGRDRVPGECEPL